MQEGPDARGPGRDSHYRVIQADRGDAELTGYSRACTPPRHHGCPGLERGRQRQPVALEEPERRDPFRLSVAFAACDSFMTIMIDKSEH